MGALSGKVAVVTGASRGIGKGIALALAEEGTTVYVTGRTVAPDMSDLPGTVAETARECERRGGRAIAVVVDHGQDEQVAALFAQVKAEQGRLDILVNNAFALPDNLTDPEPFWEKPLSDWHMMEVGVRSNYVAAWHAAQIMAPQGSGLIVAISGYTGVSYTYGVIFGSCKTAADRMAHDMAVELKDSGITSISLWQGLTMTERAERNLKNVPSLKDGASTQIKDACSPEFPGRVIAALASDSDMQRYSGGTYITAELAAEFDVRDIDGRQIHSIRETRGSPIWGSVYAG